MRGNMNMEVAPNLASQGLLPTLGCGEDPGSGWSRDTFIYSPPWGGWVEHQWCKNRLPVENSVFRRFEGVKSANKSSLLK